MKCIDYFIFFTLREAFAVTDSNSFDIENLS